MKADVEDLLGSAAISESVILLHDTANEVVRAGIDAVDLATYPKVAHADFDFVAGYLFREESLRDEIWGGLGVIIADGATSRPDGFDPRQERIHETASILREHRDRAAGGLAKRVRGRLAGRER